MFSTAFLDIPALDGAHGTVSLPGSKSISNRVLLLSAFCHGATAVHDLLDSDDTRIMLDALRQLGCGISQSSNTVVIEGFGSLRRHTTTQLFMGNAGTAMRPITAALAVLGGDYELRGVPRMHERPIKDLVEALLQLGCSIEYLENPGYPPLKIGSPKLHIDAPIQVRGDVSSQFLTSLLMALPLVATQDIVIEVVGELISKPYIEITLNLMHRFGVTVQRDAWSRFTIAGGSRYVSPGSIHVESDASSASYFIAIGAIATRAKNLKSIKVLGLDENSIQGDIRFIEAARLMGAHVSSGPNWLEISNGSNPNAEPLKAIDLDCNHMPDAAMTLAIMALYAQGTSTLRNIASWRVKETDRIAAMATELRKLGASVEEGADFIRITPPSHIDEWKTASIHTYDDHRMAMCFSLAAFNPAKLPVRIEDPKCVAKTYPDYFEALFSVSECDPKNVPVITVDGPTASGKGTLASRIAEHLGYHYLDSGALYRVTALAALRAGLSLSADNASQIAELALYLPVRFDRDTVYLGDDDVTSEIRSEEGGMNASKVSSLPEVRAALIELQHSFQKLPGLVTDGRDMGTVIFAQAQLKIFLTASAEHRADRRYKQLISKGISATLDTLRADLIARDARDSSRSVAPLAPAQDAKLLDNSDLSIETSLELVLNWWQSRQPF